MSSFLQSQEWEKFQQVVGRKTWRIQGILLIRHDLPFDFSYFYSPRPDFGESEIGPFLNEAKKIGKLEKSAFLKIEPENSNPEIFSEFLKSKKEIQPSKTVILDLTKDETEIFNKMHEKTRYNIRLAQKHNIEINELKEFDFEKIWKVFKATSEKDQFFLHPRGYYEKMMETLGPDGTLKMFGAFSDAKLIAVNLVIFYGKRATYLHGASDYQYRNFMAPHLLHWSIIQRARASGFEEYDLWGISEKYPGVSRFKLGFGGKEITYPGSFDYVFSRFWYNLYMIGSKAKDQIR